MNSLANFKALSSKHFKGHAQAEIRIETDQRLFYF